MAFSRSSRHIKLCVRDRETVLEAECKTRAGQWVKSSIILDGFLGNINGSFKIGERAFTRTAQNIHLERRSILCAQLADHLGHWGPICQLDLDLCLTNDNGRLKIVKHPQLGAKKISTISEYLDRLGPKKAEFLQTIETNINAHVAESGSGCVSIVEKSEHSKERVHDLGLNEFVPIFFCFAFGWKWNEHELESALAGPIIDIVSDAYGDLLEDSWDDAEGLLQSQLDLIAKGLCQAEIREGAVDIGSEVLAIVQNLTVTPLIMAGHANAAAFVKGDTAKNLVMKGMTKVTPKAVMKVTGKFAAQTVSEEVSKSVAQSTLKPAMTKAKLFGLGLKATLKAALAVVIVGIVVWKIARFPKNLGKKLGRQVRDAIENDLQQITSSVFATLRTYALKRAFSIILGAGLEKVNEMAMGEMKEVLEDSAKTTFRQIQDRIQVHDIPEGMQKLFVVVRRVFSSTQEVTPELLIDTVEDCLGTTATQIKEVVLKQTKADLSQPRVVALAATLLALFVGDKFVEKCV